MASRPSVCRRRLNAAMALVALLAVSLAVGSMTGWSVPWQSGSTMPSAGSAAASAADRARHEPLRIRPLERRVLPVSQDDADWIRRQIQPVEREKLSPSYCLHVLRVHGLDARFTSQSFPTGNAVLEPLLDSEVGKRVLGQASLVRVSTGARYRTRTPPEESRWREYHRDQNLAGFAEVGLPLSTVLTIEGKSLPLREVLRDSIANFHLRQSELEWTGLAYALYLPPQAEWVNRYRERYTFDDLTTELLGRRLTSGSCGGMHFLVTLTMIARADEEAPVLSESVRRRVRERLERCAQLAVEIQQPDGWWPGDWFYDSEFDEGRDGPSPPASPADRLIMTGHMAEWMLYLPRDFQVPETTLKRAGRWLLGYLKQVSADDMSKQICPHTHGICVLRELSFVDGAGGRGPPRDG